MDKLKNFQEFPLLFLFSYLLLCFFRSPQIADSIILIGLCLLQSYRFFVQYNPKPSLDEQLLQYDTKIQKILENETQKHLQEIQQIKSEVNEFTRNYLTFKGLNKNEITSKEVNNVSKIRF